MPHKPSARLDAVVAALCYLAITLLLFRNLLSTVTTHLYADLGDPLLNTAILVWNATHLPLSSAWWNFPAFAPLSGVTAFTEHLIAAYPVASPIIWTTGNAVLAYNILLLLCLPLNGLMTFLLVREVTGSRTAGFVGGLAFAFAPYQAENVSHLQLLMAFGMPTALFGLHRYARTGRRAALAWFACGWLIALLSNAYMLIFFPLVVGLWMVWFLRGTGVWRWVEVGVVTVLATLPLVPLLWGYHVRQEAYGLARGYSEIENLSADLIALVGVSHRAVLWSHALPTTFYESSLFPGIAILILTVVAVSERVRRGGTAAWRRRDVIVFYFTAAILMWSLTLGPEPTWDGARALGYGPYWLLLQLPGIQNLRVPARAWLPAALCLAVCAGAGASWLAQGARRRWLLVPLAMLMVAEGWFYAEAQPAPKPMFGASFPANALVLDLPLWDTYRNADPQYLAVLGRYRVVNGYSGYSPPHFNSLRHELGDHRHEGLDALRQLADLYVIVRSEVDQPFVEWLQQQRGIEHLFDAGGAKVYRLPRSSGDPAPPMPLPLPPRGQAAFVVP
jgi:hypothetical protein